MVFKHFLHKIQQHLIKSKPNEARRITFVVKAEKRLRSQVFKGFIEVLVECNKHLAGFHQRLPHPTSSLFMREVANIYPPFCYRTERKWRKLYRNIVEALAREFVALELRYEAESNRIMIWWSFVGWNFGSVNGEEETMFHFGSHKLLSLVWSSKQLVVQRNSMSEILSSVRRVILKRADASLPPLEKPKIPLLKFATFY